jgi:hypothetical protein
VYGIDARTCVLARALGQRLEDRLGPHIGKALDVAVANSQAIAEIISPNFDAILSAEVAHIRHMNHSADFYAWLDTLYEGNRKAADQWLKMHGTGLQRVGR